MATRYQFVDDSGETRLAGFLVPEPGGSGSAVTVVGPYPVTYQTAGIDQDGVLLGPFLSDGQTVLNMWPIVSEAFASDGAPGMALGVATDPANDGFVCRGVQVGGTPDATPGAFTLTSTAVAGSPINFREAAIQGDGQVKLFVSITFGLVYTAGAADIYALVHTPA